MHWKSVWTNHENSFWTKHRNSVCARHQSIVWARRENSDISPSQVPLQFFPWFLIFLFPFLFPPVSAFFHFHYKAARLQGQPHLTLLIIKWLFPQLPVPSFSTRIRVPVRSPSRGRLVGPSSAPASSSSSAATHPPPSLPARASQIHEFRTGDLNISAVAI